MDTRSTTASGSILLDVPAGEGHFEQDMLERLEHDVIVCNGPTAQSPCPLLIGERCEKLEQAHGIIIELDLDKREHREIIERYEELSRSGTPIRVVVKPGQRLRYEELLRAVQVWERDPTISDLDGFAAQVEAADLS